MSGVYETGAGADGWRYSTTVKRRIALFGGGGARAAGELVMDLFGSHSNYLDERLGIPDLKGRGPERTVDEHISLACERWDFSRAGPKLTGWHVIVALALDPPLGLLMIHDGVLPSLLQLWYAERARFGAAGLVAWDLLSDAGRGAAEVYLPMATAVGAPAEWGARLPADVTAMAWSPRGDRIAVHAGGMVYEIRQGVGPRQVSRLGAARLTRLGWGDQGLVSLQVLEDGSASLTRVSDGAVLGTVQGVTVGVLSGDGTRAVLQTSAGAGSWSPGETDLTSLGPATAPLAVDWDGQLALLATSLGRDVLVATKLPTRDETARADAESGGRGRPDWPPDAAPLMAWGPELSSSAPSPPPEVPHALATVRGGLAAAAAPGADGGVTVQRLPFPPVTRIASGPGPVTALAADPTQSRLAVAVGGEVGVWTIDRGTAAVPGYDSDLAVGDDLLDADRDAQALASLIASAELIPPLAVGLFGAWGSGKSFVLNRIAAFLEQLTGPAAPGGYLRHVKVVPFNAWHYAETNLWASLVDEVLVKIGPAGKVRPSAEVSQANIEAARAESDAENLAGEVADTERDLRRALRRQAQRRRRTWLLAAAALAVIAGAAAVGVFYGPGRLVAGWTVAITLLASASAALAEARKIRSQASEVIQAGRQAKDAAAEAFGRLTGAAEAEVIRKAGRDLRERQHQLDLARQEASRLRARADELGELASSSSLGSVLSRLASVSEYRDQLSLVTRTRERFAAIDRAVAEGRQARSGAVNQRGVPGPEQTSMEPVNTDRQNSAPDKTQLERVVVIIDDLDRCPPEKVVEVLEAVHLLFDFAMFVVIIAVDTRWLAQSLRIRYRRLLGSTETAASSDYLEKIIQIPLNLLPLSETQTQAMISGLVGSSRQPLTTPTTGRAEAEMDRPDADQAEGDQVTADNAAARRARTPRRSPSGLSAEILRTTPKEADAMSEMAAMVGTTPRTVKRFVNTYRLLKARADDPEEFDATSEDGLGDHQVVAFLLALVTGHAELARRLLPAVQCATPGNTLLEVINGLGTPAAAAGLLPGPTTVPETVTTWLGCHQIYAQARAARYASWAAVVARFSFSG
jgi:hypothetical protein